MVSTRSVVSGIAAGVLLLLPSKAYVQTPKSEAAQAAAKPADAPDTTTALLQIKRIYVESFGDDTASKQIQAMLINSLSECKRFVITENKDRADAVLKGSTLEQSSQELHSSSELTVAGHEAIGDAQKSTETIHEARVAVRLVAADGDVVWTSTQESNGAKYKSASADVADKVVKQLLHDLEKLEKKPITPPEKPS